MKSILTKENWEFLKAHGIVCESINDDSIEKFRNKLLKSYPLDALRFSSILNVDEPILRIDMIRVKEDSLNSGFGSKVMHEIIKFADANNLILALTPEKPENAKGMSDSKLKKWYSNFGFIPNSGKNRNFDVIASMLKLPKK